MTPLQNQSRKATLKQHKLENLIRDLTYRLVTCPIGQFSEVQAELFKAQNELKGLTK